MKCKDKLFFLDKLSYFIVFVSCVLTCQSFEESNMIFNQHIVDIIRLNYAKNITDHSFFDIEDVFSSFLGRLNS